VDSLTPTDNVVGYLETNGAQSRVRPDKPLPVTDARSLQSSQEPTPVELLGLILVELQTLNTKLEQLQGPIFTPN
jgi:hypothetical protein